MLCTTYITGQTGGRVHSYTHGGKIKRAQPPKTRGRVAPVRRCASRDEACRHKLRACATSKVRASQLAPVATSGKSRQAVNRLSAGGSKTRTPHKKRRSSSMRAPMQDATRHTERPTDASVAPAAASVPFERSSPGRGRTGSEELVDGSTCALAVPMATTCTSASSPQPAAVAADDTALTAAPSSWRQRRAQRGRLESCRPSSSTTRASVTLRDPSGSAPSLAPSPHDHTVARATSVEAPCVERGGAAVWLLIRRALADVLVFRGLLKDYFLAAV